MRLALAGANGFVGRAVATEARRHDVEVIGIRSPRLKFSGRTNPASLSRAWINSHPGDFEALVAMLEGVDVIVNAAGLATPDSQATGPLYGANAVLPAVLAQAAATAGVPRMVHISSAAVQGRREPLDETRGVDPLTPYGDSKASGEAVLFERHVETPRELVVYRPTSVQAATRSMTRQLVRFASLPAIPTCHRGEAPLPLALIDNVAAGIVHVCRAATCPEVVLQPWEGMTLRSLLAAWGRARVVPVPQLVARASLGLLYAGGRIAPPLAAAARRLELITFGQAQDARALRVLGFSPPAGAAAYRKLAEEVSRRWGRDAHQ